MTVPAEPHRYTTLQIESWHTICKEQLSVDHKVVFVCGAGITLSEYPAEGSWSALLANGADFAQTQGVAARAVKRIKALIAANATADDYLRAGELLTTELKGKGVFQYWLNNSVGDFFTKSKGVLLQAIAKCVGLERVRLATTNYDFLLERAMGWQHGSPAPLPSFSWMDARVLVDWHRGQVPKQVYHMHGHARAPESIVLGCTSYASLNVEDWVSRSRTVMTVTDTVIFLGCGATLQDPAFKKFFDGSLSPILTANQNRKWFQLVKNAEAVGHPCLTPLPYGDNRDDLPKFIANELYTWLGGTPNIPNPPSPPTDASINAAEIAVARLAILNLLNKAHFPWLDATLFADDGMPLLIDAAFRGAIADVPTLSKAKIVSCLVEAIIEFAEQVVSAFCKLDLSSPIRILSSRKSVYSRFVKAVQLLLLLSANRVKLPTNGVDAAFNVDVLLELELMFSELVSLVLRADLSKNLRVQVQAGKPSKLVDSDFLTFDGPEMGPMRDSKSDPPKNAMMKVAYRHLYPAAAEFPDNPTEKECVALLGQTVGRKTRGQPLISVFEASNALGEPTIKWLKGTLNVGVVTISGKLGTFEMNEGVILDVLQKLLETLEPISN